MNKICKSLFMILPVMLVACGGDKPAPQEETPATAAAQPSMKTKLQISQLSGALSAEAAAAGQAAVSSRITGKRESMGEIAFDPAGRLGVHPGRDAASWVKFDVSGLTSLELYPAIKSLNASCRENPQAGTVNLSIYADGQLVDKVLPINRETKEFAQVTLEGAKELRFEVDNQNGSISCDWFVISFANVN